jgi:hypothetical protein
MEGKDVIHVALPCQRLAACLERQPGDFLHLPARRMIAGQPFGIADGDRAAMRAERDGLPHAEQAVRQIGRIHLNVHRAGKGPHRFRRCLDRGCRQNGAGRHGSTSRQRKTNGPHFSSNCPFMFNTNRRVRSAPVWMASNAMPPASTDFAISLPSSTPNWSNGLMPSKNGIGKDPMFIKRNQRTQRARFQRVEQDRGGRPVPRISPRRIIMARARPSAQHLAQSNSRATAGGARHPVHAPAPPRPETPREPDACPDAAAGTRRAAHPFPPRPR